MLIKHNKPNFNKFKKELQQDDCVEGKKSSNFTIIKMVNPTHDFRFPSAQPIPNKLKPFV